MPLNKIRTITAEHMVRSLGVSAHVYVSTEVDYESIDRVRTAHKAAFKAEEGVSLTYLPFVARALVDALDELEIRGGRHLAVGEAQGVAGEEAADAGDGDGHARDEGEGEIPVDGRGIERDGEAGDGEDRPDTDDGIRRRDEDDVGAGDGIGQEVVPEGLRVLDAAARRFGVDLHVDQVQQ